MKIPLRELPCHRRVELGSTFVGQAVATLPMRTALERPADDPDAGSAAAELDLYQEGDNVFARGQLAGWVEVACSRCVGPVRIVVDEPLQVTFMPAARLPDEADEDEDEAAAPGEEPAEFDEDDLDLYPYTGEEIDLEPLLREQIILAVPFAPLCREDCKGLCPSCGIDLNNGSCTCVREKADPRWSALRNLKPE